MSDKKNSKKEIVSKTELPAKTLLAPLVTEASSAALEMNKYIFKVFAEADKKAVKKSVEEIYGVKVERVNISNVRGKIRRRGSVSGWKGGFKKATVTLKEGEKISLFEE